MKKQVMTVAVVAALFSMTAHASQFDGLYIGGKVGTNRSDITGAATAAKQNATTFGIEEGYNWDMGGFLLGGDLFADFNQKTSRAATGTFAGPTVNSGSTTVGLDAKLGLPMGSWLPYVKLGWDRTTGTGALPAAQFKYTNDLHKGLGLEFKFAPQWSVAGEWTQSASKINGSRLRNDNFTVGLNYYFNAPRVAYVAPVEPPVVARPQPKVEPVAPPVAKPAEPVYKTIFSDKPVTIEGANFDTNSAKLKPSADKKLNEVVDFAAKHQDTGLVVSGHTDNRGSLKLNQKLSKARAESVKAYLVKKGVSAKRITTKGEGFSRPIADNKTKAGRAKNRRVEIDAVVREEKKVRVK